MLIIVRCFVRCYDVLLTFIGSRMIMESGCRLGLNCVNNPGCCPSAKIGLYTRELNLF
jgi:hypothetical protein